MGCLAYVFFVVMDKAFVIRGLFWSLRTLLFCGKEAHNSVEQLEKKTDNS